MEWYDQDERFNPSVRQLPLQRGWLIDHPQEEPNSRNVWAFMEDGQLASIPDEDTARILAETFFDTIICFFADTVDHPHS